MNPNTPPGLAPTHSGLWFRRVLVALALICSFAFDFGPTVYVGDFVAFAALPLVMLSWFYHAELKPERVASRWVIAGLILFIAIGIVSDFHNSEENLLRGFLRNASMVGLALAVVWSGRRYGLAFAAIIWFAVRLSQALSGIPEFYVGILPLQDYIKYNGAAVLGLLPLLFIRNNVLAGALLVANGILQVLYFETRGGGAVFCAAGLFIMLLAVGAAMNRKLAITLALIGSIAVIGAAYYAFVFTNILTDNAVRSASSNQMRILMIEDSWDMFLQSPWLGNGSLSLSDRFLDGLDKRSNLTVHSVAFQWLGEYGVIGGITALMAIVAVALALLKMSKVMRAISPLTLSLVILAAFEIGALLFLNVFSGYARIRLGMSLGLCVAFLEFKPQDPAFASQTKRR